VFAEADGQLFVRVDAVMHPFVAFSDGLNLFHFKRDRHMYLKIDDAIDWCKKEREHHSREKYDQMIAVMERAVRENAQTSVR
jgi:hypothetical protein